jgi:flagellar hook-length control protein FliK
VEINQAISMPQTASTGSSGASAAGSETGNDGFLTLFNKFKCDGAGEDADAADATGQTTQNAATIPDGVLSLIAPGLFSNLIIQPQQPVSGDAAAGGEAGEDLAATGAAGEAPAGELPAGEAGTDPLGALAPGMLQPPPGPRPDLPAKGLAPRPQDGKPAADGDDAAGNEAGQDAEAQLGEEDLAKLVSEGKAILQAQQGKTQGDKSEASAKQAQATQTPSVQAQSTQVPTIQVQSAQTQSAQAQSAQAQSAQAQSAQAQSTQIQSTQAQSTQAQSAQTQAVQAAAGEKDAAPNTATIQVSREPAATQRTAETQSVGNDSPAAESADRDAKPVPSTDGEPAQAADAGTGDGNPQADSGDTGQEGETNGSRQAQQHAARIEKAGEQAAQQPEGKNASETSVRNAAAEPENRGGAAVRTLPGAADDGGKAPAGGKGRAEEAGPSFEESLIKAKAAHKEPEAEAILGAQAPAAAPAEMEAADRAAAPHTRGALPHSAADQVSVQLGKAAAGKSDQMVINLKPVELGNVEVKLDFGADGRVQASIMAERPETLEMLQKDQRTLERALNDAGLQTDAGSLSFNLKGQGQNGNQRQFTGYNQPGGGRGKGFARIESEGPAIPDFAAPRYSASAANRNRLDIRI